MNCREALDLMHGYVDGELDLERIVEIEQHLGACPVCKVQYDRARDLGAGIRAHADYHAAPAALRARIATALPRESGAGVRPAWRWAWMASALAFVTLLGLGLGLALLRPGADERLERQLIEAHVRSLMADHLMDIASSDQHTVKPWMAGKLDFSPPVEDLAAHGYALAGGRLDYLDQHSVMALVYRRHAHVINLFVWPQATAVDLPLRTDSHRGYNVVHFSRAGMEFWGVSDLNAEELKDFAKLF